MEPSPWMKVPIACDTPKGGHVITEKGATPRVA